MSDIAIKVENLSKLYQIGTQKSGSLRESLLDKWRWISGRKESTTTEEFWALNDVSFEIKQGEAVGIIGKNGAGKSTLLKILSRITEPTKGRIEINGRVASLLEVGTGFHPELSGRENIYLNGTILGMTRREIKAKFDEIVAFSGVEKFIDTPVKYYSSGMYVRLAFAVAAHLEPEILIIDEVLAVGDAEFQKKCLGKMGEVAGKGRTVLFVSHNMQAINQLCQSCILLKKGQIAYQGFDIPFAINNYLSSDGRLLSGYWENSGLHSNPYFTPTKFYISNNKGEIINTPTPSNTDIYITIEGYLQKLTSALSLGYAIYDNEHNTLFWSYHTDSEEINWPELKMGYNVLRSRLPKRFLNEGNYRMELIGGLHMQEWFWEPTTDVPQIKLVIETGLSDSPNWINKRPGILAPIIDWYNE